MDGVAGDLLAKLLGDALGDIEGAEVVREMSARQTQIDEAQRAREIAIVSRVIDPDSEAGRAFLVWLARKTVLRSPGDLEIGAATAETFAMHGQRRIGQNQIFFLIVDVLKQAQARQSGGEA